ncbi:hypothetical protein F5Y13DRAFT_105109 [Hypoxylon sp. FL1857]|nr:hypothetical protein F5Y13DRAFT_105109 [Hypoxylon sp. FL1857]
MAQQGGTYHPPESMVPLLALTYQFPKFITSCIEVESPIRSNLSSQTQSAEKVSTIQERGDGTRRDQDDQNDDQQWTVVSHPEASIESPPSQGTSSHFDITLGWGSRKFTVFSWDMSIRKEAGEPPQRDMQERK